MKNDWNKDTIANGKHEITGFNWYYYKIVLIHIKEGIKKYNNNPMRLIPNIHYEVGKASIG